MPLLLLALALAGGAPTATLHVTGPDYGVEVAIDRRPAGRLPLDPVPVAPGLHLVELLRGGEVVWSRVVFVDPGATVEVAVVLERSAQPSPTLGQLKHGTPAGPDPPTRYRLTGRLMLESAAAGDAWDLDIAQRWRLEAQPEGPLSAAAAVRAVGDLAGNEPELWRALHRVDDDPLLVEALWLRAAYDDLSARVGRMAQQGPMGRAFWLDGARAQASIGAVDVSARGGWRRAVLEPEPDDPWLGGARVAIREGGWSAEADVLYHQGLHVDVTARARVDGLGIALSGGALDTAPMYADGQLRLALEHRTDGWLRHGVIRTRWRSAQPSPFDLLPIWRSLLTLDVPAGWTGDALLAAHAGPVEFDLLGGVFDGAGAPRVERPDRWWAGLDARLPRHTWGASLGVRLLGADVGEMPQANGLTGRWRGDVGAWLAIDRLRLEGVAGIERLALDGPDGAVHRTLPVGGLRARIALTDDIAFIGAGDISAAHPTLHPTGGPVVYGRAGLELR